MNYILSRRNPSEIFNIVVISHSINVVYDRQVIRIRYERLCNETMSAPQLACPVLMKCYLWIPICVKRLLEYCLLFYSYSTHCIDFT